MNHLNIKGTVYACDSFEGLPKPDTKNYPADDGDGHYQIDNLKVSEEVVRANFHKYGVLDGVVFVKGWFKDTMPELKKQIQRIAILRLDGDMYESTVNVLDNLYDLVVCGGFIIIDDYCLKNCKTAIDEFIQDKGITLNRVDQCIHYFRKC